MTLDKNRTTLSAACLKENDGIQNDNEFSNNLKEERSM